MSTVSIQQQMRALVDQYEAGLLDQEDYRRLRSGLLDRAAKGEYDAPELSNLTRPREAARAKPAAAPAPSPAKPKSPEPTVERLRKEQAKTQETSDAKSGGSGKWIAIGALALVLAAAGWWFGQQGESTTEQDSVDTGVPAETGLMEEVVVKFMQVDDWTPRAIREFTLSWQDFTPQQRAQAESSIWYRRFVRDLHRCSACDGRAVRGGRRRRPVGDGTLRCVHWPLSCTGRHAVRPRRNWSTRIAHPAPD